MLTTLAHKIMLDPTVAQANYFARSCGVARFTWNWALAKWNEMHAAGEADRWFLSVNVQTLDTRSIAEAVGDSGVGVDLGISALATLSTGEVVEGPKPLRAALKKLRRANQSLARKMKGSGNRKKAVLLLQCLHARIGDIRTDFIHKLTTRLCRENQTVVIEDLRMAFMLKNRHCARAASDMGLGEFQRQMKYKAPLFGTELIIADRFYPSTRMCSSCGALRDMPLSERTYRCNNCGLVLSRDHNAALNLERLSTPGFGGIYACEQEGSGSPIAEKRNHAWMKQELANRSEGDVMNGHLRAQI